MKLRTRDDVACAQQKIVIKAVAKAVKVAKAFVVLRWTKKLKAMKQADASEQEVEQASDSLQQAKSINHVELGSHLAAERYPRLVKGEDFPTTCSADMIRQITTSKQFSQALEGLVESIKKTMAKKSKGLLKAEVTAAADARRAKAKEAAATSSAMGTVKVKKRKIPAGKAMFMDSLDGAEVVVPAAKPIDEEAWAERKRLKGLRNQRNRIVNKLKRDQADDPEMQKYLPVHLRNLPEPAKKGQKGSSQPNAGTASQPTSAGGTSERPERKPRGRSPAPAVGGGDGPRWGEARKRSFEQPAPAPQPERAFKRARPEPTPAAPPAAPVDQKAITTGKDWQQTGIHPSWAAKQMKAQQTIKIDAAPVAKKIVFDE